MSLRALYADTAQLTGFQGPTEAHIAMKRGDAAGMFLGGQSISEGNVHDGGLTTTGDSPEASLKSEA